jgi:hypothetical protein
MVRVPGMTLRRSTPRIAGAVLTCSLLLLLTSCGPKAALSVKGDESGAHFAVCQDMVIDSIRVSLVDKDSHDSTTLWEVHGTVSLPAGSIVQYGKTPEGMETTIPAVSLQTANQFLDIHLDGTGSVGQTLRHFGHFDGDALNEDHWIRNNGTIGDDPC